MGRACKDLARESLLSRATIFHQAKGEKANDALTPKVSFGGATSRSGRVRASIGRFEHVPAADVLFILHPPALALGFRAPDRPSLARPPTCPVGGGRSAGRGLEIRRPRAEPTAAGSYIALWWISGRVDRRPPADEGGSGRPGAPGPGSRRPAGPARGARSDRAERPLKTLGGRPAGRPPEGPTSSLNAGHAVESPVAPTNVAATLNVSEMFVKRNIASELNPGEIGFRPALG